MHLSAIGLPPLELVDLKAQGLQAAGLEVADLFGTNQPDYPRTRAWALHIWQTMPRAHGMVWMSRRVNTDAALILFGDRVAASSLSVITPPTPIAYYETLVLSMLDRLGCGTLS